MAKKIGACGIQCSRCSKYLATWEKELPELGTLPGLGHQCGWRNGVLPLEVRKCAGCTKEQECQEAVLRCQPERGVRTCDQCAEFPLCGPFRAILGEELLSQGRHSLAACPAAERANSEETFFKQWLRMDLSRQRLAKTLMRAIGDIRLDGYRILVSENEEGVREALRMLFELSGAEVEGCARATETLEALGTFDPHLITTDSRNLEVNGYELLEYLRKDREAQLPVVIVSFRVGGDAQRLARGFAAGANDILVKPFGPEALLLCVKNLLERQARGLILEYEAGARGRSTPT